MVLKDDRVKQCLRSLRSLFNGIVYLFVDGELRFEPSSLRLPTLPFQLRLRNTAEPGRRLPCTDCATAERVVLVKDRTETGS